MRKKIYYRCKNCNRIVHEWEVRKSFSSGIEYHVVVEKTYLGMSESTTYKRIDCGEIERIEGKE